MEVQEQERQSVMNLSESDLNKEKNQMSEKMMNVFEPVMFPSENYLWYLYIMLHMSFWLFSMWETIRLLNFFYFGGTKRRVLDLWKLLSRIRLFRFKGKRGMNYLLMRFILYQFWTIFVTFWLLFARFYHHSYFLWFLHLITKFHPYLKHYFQ